MTWAWLPAEGVAANHLEHVMPLNTDEPPLHRTDPAQPFDPRAPVYRLCYHAPAAPVVLPPPNMVRPTFRQHLAFRVFPPSDLACEVTYVVVDSFGPYRSVELDELREIHERFASGDRAVTLDQLREERALARQGGRR